ncbi:hypothetical protein AMECASPLE_028915 [Ameca splendens]|uniref:Uncharacterized protein n=1 Tax=Ameca splendens TaxID=208324 RepID=A0ABV0XUU2_9TELE
MHGGAVHSTVALQQERSWVQLPGGLSAWSCVMCGFSPGTLASSQITVRLIDLFKLPLAVSGCVNGCLSVMSLCVPAMDWRPVQGGPRPSPTAGDRHQLPWDPVWKKRV